MKNDEFGVDPGQIHQNLAPNLTSNPLQLFTTFLEAIIQISQKPDLEDAKEQILEHINHQINSTNKNLYRNLHDILSEAFKISFKRAHANFEVFDEAIKKDGVLKLQKYIECLKLAHEFRNNPGTKFLTFYKFFFQLCQKQNRQSLFWTNEKRQTFVELLILSSKGKEQHIIKFLEHFEGSLTGKIYSQMDVETLLFRILKAIVRSNSQRKEKYGQIILDIALRKEIDLNEGDIDGTGNYCEQIAQCGVDPYEMDKALLMMNKSDKKSNDVHYFIYNDQKKGDKKRISYGEEFNCQMKTFLAIVSQKGEMTINKPDYQFQVNLNDGKFMASLHQNQQTYTGFLVPAIQPFLEEYEWEIFDQINWRKVTLKQQKKTQLLKNSKNKRGELQLLLTELDLKLQIDLKKFRVKKICQQTNEAEPFGIIYWKPIYNVIEFKNDRLPERQTTHDEEEEVENVIVEKLFKPAQKNKFLLELDNQTKEYPFLAILANHIPSSCNIRINRQEKSVKAFDQPSIRKIKRWIDDLEILFLEAFTGDSSNPKQIKHQLKNQNVIDTVKEKIVQFLPGNLKDNIFASNGSLKVVRVMRNEDFVKDFVKYLVQIELQNLSKQKYTLSVPKEQVEDIKIVIESFDDAQIKINTKSKLVDFGKSKNPNQIELKASPQKISALIQAVNDQNHITHGSNNLVGLLHYQDAEPHEYIEAIKNLTINQLNDRFEIIGKKMQVFAFWARFNIFLQKVEQKKFNEQKVTIKFQGEGSNLKMFENIAEDLTDAQVHLKGNDIQVETLRKNRTKYQAHFKSKIKDLKFEIIEKSRTQFQLKHIEDYLCRCLEKILRNKIAQLKKFKNENLGHVECDLIDSKNTIYKFTLNWGNQDEIQAFHKIGQNFKMRYFQYKNELYQLRKTNQIEKNTIKPLRQIKLTSKEQTQTLLKLTSKYKQKVHKLIEDVFEQKKTLLQNDFTDFITNKPIDQKYKCLANIDIEQTLTAKNEGIFYEYLQELIQQKSKNLPLRKQEFQKRKKFILDRVELQVYELDQNLINKNLNNKKVKRIMMSIKVLVASYFTTNLPIVSHLEDFAQCIERYDNIIVKTGTGSGKSTMLPPYLIAMGYDRVVVTQPRRLPCAMICKRIKKTHSADLVGYSYAGAQQCPQNPLHYTTDGYLKVQLYSHPDITKDIDVLILDQIHERSKNIDLILAKISQLRKINPKLKVVLCSATVDENIIKIIDNSNNYGVFKIQIKRYEVKQFKIQNQSILEKANDLSARLKKNEKMLIFFPGVDQVNQAVTTFKQKYKKLAFPLHGNQKNSQQDEIIENGQIFIATSIAETSLTFENLKFVLDSRKARYVTFDEARGTYVTQQKIASNSSATQRKGRVGRDGPGEYYYFENIETGRMNQDEFDMTELDRIDLTNVVFELMIKYKDISKVKQILKKLMNDSQSFRRKFNYSLTLLKQMRIIDSSEKLKNIRQTNEILTYGNLSDIRLNIALTKANDAGCSVEMAIIASFMMYGSKIIDSVLSSIPSNKYHPSGDIMTICIWMSKICENIKLNSLALEHIFTEACKFPEIVHKPYFSTLIRILKQIKRFQYKITNFQSNLDWNIICQCLMDKAFKNQIYFHEVNLGGQKGTYSKLIEGRQFTSNKNKFNEIQYKINQKSILYQSDLDKLPSVILSLSSFCNTVDDSTLSFCSRLSKECQRDIQFTYDVSQQLIPYEIPAINESQYLKKQIGGSYANNRYSYKANFNTLSQWYQSFSNTLFNKNTEIDLANILQQQIKAKNINENRAKILREQYEKISFFDIFSPLKFQFENLYDVNMKIPFNSKKKLVISNASNSLLRAIVKRIKSFFTWFVMCQNICQQDKKVDPQLIHKKKMIDQNIAWGIEKRINMIVDSSIEYHIVRSWTHSQTNQYSSRTMRMTAVCWILTNKFHCSIKGGFVRDWVVRNHQYLPNKNLTTILDRNPLNNHLQIIDDTVSPMDIDADLPSGKFFDLRKFYQEMLKLNIQMQVSDPQECSNGPDYWRIHIVFDKDSPTGPFTADLIQPYCQIAHDKCDFDVNLFYLKKDWKGAIGLKIPLEIRPVKCDNSDNDIKYTLEELLKNCIDKKMRQINAEVGVSRRRKFQARGWTVDPIIYEPTIYKSKRTTSYRMDVEDFKKHFPEFMQKMENAKIVEVLQLKNSNLDLCYDSVRQWIINEGQKTNEKFLFHGSKEAGISGIYDGGFDSRYFARDGYYGRGAYFADDSLKSHEYTEPCPKFNNFRCMFVCKVALGKQEHCKQAANGKLGPSPGYHSILGTAGSHTQYIIDRFGQAKPMFLIKYR